MSTKKGIQVSLMWRFNKYLDTPTGRHDLDAHTTEDVLSRSQVFLLNNQPDLSSINMIAKMTIKQQPTSPVLKMKQTIPSSIVSIPNSSCYTYQLSYNWYDVNSIHRHCQGITLCCTFCDNKDKPSINR